MNKEAFGLLNARLTRDSQEFERRRGVLSEALGQTTVMVWPEGLQNLRDHISMAINAMKEANSAVAAIATHDTLPTDPEWQDNCLQTVDEALDGLEQVLRRFELPAILEDGHNAQTARQRAARRNLCLADMRLAADSYVTNGRGLMVLLIDAM